MTTRTRRATAAAPTAYARQLVSTAQAEEATYGKLDENDPPLKKRIRQYCRDLGFEEPSNIGAYAWSAVFVSWCVKTAGATKEEFRFAEAHAVFVKWAIANADQNRSVFRAWPIKDYAPQLGDILHNNRGGHKYDYDYAREHADYESHSAIIVDFIEKDRVRYAVTIGGNEGNTVAHKNVRLDANGFVVQRTTDPYISIIQTLKKGDDEGGVFVARENVTLPASFRKHGTFIYEAGATIDDYGSIDNAVVAMNRAGMTHAWIRIHGRLPYAATEKRRIRDFVTAIKAASIGVAGWGWCQGENAENEVALALRESAYFGLPDYIADIEQGVSNANWNLQEIETFCRAIRADLPGSFGITSFALIDWHAPELMKAALPFVHFFNPQVYWFDFPNQQMVDQFRRPDGTRYKRDHPGEYMDLCIDRWNTLMGADRRPLVVSGQAYWGEGAAQADAESHLETFLEDWKGYAGVAGLNWWHFGGTSAMSHRMLEAITAAKLGDKPYASP